jgi:outer membrane protein OmpU
MKKLLLATSALVASAGFAMAEVTLSGSGELGIASSESTTGGNTQGFNDGDAHVYSGVTLDVTFSGASDNGLEFGASLNIEASSADYDPGDWEFDNAEPLNPTSVSFDPSTCSQSGSTVTCGPGSINGTEGVSFGNVYIASGGVKLTVDSNGIDDLYDDDNASHDAMLSYSGGGISASVTMDVDDSASSTDMTYSFGYSANGISVGLKGNDDDQMELSASYSTDAFSVGVTLDDDEGSQTNTVDASFTTGAFTVSGEFADDDSWELGASYSDGGVTVGATISENSSGDQTTRLTAEMDAGGGLTLIGGLQDSDDSEKGSAWYMGAKMSF